MEFENLKENIREIFNKYLDNIDEVQMENNEYEDEDGNQAVCDGYFAIATLIQRGFNEAMKEVYETIPEDYWDDAEQCGCNHGDCDCHHDSDCCCGQHDEHDCCCGQHDENDCCCGQHDEHDCCNHKH